MNILEENPYILDVTTMGVYHSAFTHALAMEDIETSRQEKKILFALLSGNDTSIQAIKAYIDLGWGSASGIQFGKGKKGITCYEMIKDKEDEDENKIIKLYSERGSYSKTNMNLSPTAKAVMFIHKDIEEEGKYVISLSENPAEDVANFLAGAKYGLHLLDEWKQTVYEELINEELLIEKDFFSDDSLFDFQPHFFSVHMDESKADKFLLNLLQTGKIKFPYPVSESNLQDVESLTDYLQKFSGHMLSKISNQIDPLHDMEKDAPSTILEEYKIPLFERQAHVTTACAKRILHNKALILQGDMSTGKSFMMTAIADIYNKMKNRKGYFASVLCPVSLTKKWPSEIKRLLPDVDVYVVNKTKDLIDYHLKWIEAGRPKPVKPTFFIISFTTMRNDCASEPGVQYVNKSTENTRENGAYYKQGYHCPSCGESLKIKSDDKVSDVPMTMLEFSGNRRTTNNKKPQNAFCLNCGESLWSKKVINRYGSFKEWTKHADELLNAINNKDLEAIEHIQRSQEPLKSSTNYPRRVATIEYIRRKMKKFFDISIADEIHELKGGNTAQGNSLGSLAAASKKIIGGTGTLFGGKAEDIYYLMWRMFPGEMVRSGFKYEEVTKFNQVYGNVETTYYGQPEEKEDSNTHSRGGFTKTRTKIVPGISSFVYGEYLFRNVVNVRLLEVWENPVELADIPTVFVPMPDELKEKYTEMINEFDEIIHSGAAYGKTLSSMKLDYGVAYPDNPFTFPSAYFKTQDEGKVLIWKSQLMDPNITLPKEQKLMDIITNERIEGRKSIVYVRDTGSTNKGRDVRPRLKAKLEESGAKVCILDTTTTANNNRSEWLKQKIEVEGYDVCIVNQSLVKVGLDLLCTPTLIYYQFHWSLFTINQSAKRAYRIGQTQDCRLFYLAYDDSYQKDMANVIARKNMAASAISGEVSSEGISAMLGQDDDLQTMLLKAINNTNKEDDSDVQQEVSENIQSILNNLDLIASGDRVYSPILLESSEIHLLEDELSIEDEAVVAKPLIIDFEEVSSKVKEKVSNVKEKPKKKAQKTTTAKVIVYAISDLSTVKNKKKVSQNQLSFFDLLG